MVKLDFGPRSFLRDFAFSFVRSALSLLRRLSGEPVDIADIHRLIDASMSDGNYFTVGGSAESDAEQAYLEVKNNE